MSCEHDVRYLFRIDLFHYYNLEKLLCLTRVFLVLRLTLIVKHSVLNKFFFFLCEQKQNLCMCLCFYDSADEVLLKPSGAQLTVEFLEEHSFSVPVMVLRRDGLGMTLPPSSFGVSDVEHYIGTHTTHLVLNLNTYLCIVL